MLARVCPTRIAFRVRFPEADTNSEALDAPVCAFDTWKRLYQVIAMQRSPREMARLLPPEFVVQSIMWPLQDEGRPLPVISVITTLSCVSRTSHICRQVSKCHNAPPNSLSLSAAFTFFWRPCCYSNRPLYGFT